jgi:hypothetical protein
MFDRKEYNKNYYEKNKDRLNLNSRLNFKNYYEKNKDELNLKRKLRYYNNIEKEKLKSKFYYENNKEKLFLYRKLYFKKARQFVNRIKLKFGCKSCGYKQHAQALHFDHINRNEKYRGISRLNSFKRLKEEMRKCQILCSNCHAIKTYRNKDYKKIN